MKRSRFSEEQIIGILREHEVGAPTADICQKYGISSAKGQRAGANRADLRLEHVERQADAHHHGGACRVRARTYSRARQIRSRGGQGPRRRARRQEGQRPSDKKAKKVLGLHKEGLSHRLIGRNVGLSKNTVMEIVKRETAPKHA
jgi:hypothetical protein